MVGGMLLAMAMTVASGAQDSRLEQLFGMKLPAWGSTPGDIERAYPKVRTHEPHWCANELGDPSTRELRQPNVSVAGVPVKFIDFGQSPEGLESITFDLGPASSSERRGLLVQHLTRVLGPAAEERRSATLWSLPTARVVALGSAIFVVRPGTRAARTVDALIPKEDAESETK